MNLEQLMKAGLITQADIDRMLERATGGKHVTEEQRETIAAAQAHFLRALDDLYALGVVIKSESRYASAQKNIRKAVVQAVKDNEAVIDRVLGQNEEEE
jgi:hypothetical protein|tara:strand:+ start:101 stop:397 length:297 start_codon:yes stop_codon:yes gene_type:complete